MPPSDISVLFCWLPAFLKRAPQLPLRALGEAHFTILSQGLFSQQEMGVVLRGRQGAWMRKTSCEDSRHTVAVTENSASKPNSFSFTVVPTAFPSQELSDHRGVYPQLIRIQLLKSTGGLEQSYPSTPAF